MLQLVTVSLAAAIGGFMLPGLAQAQPDSSDCAAYGGSSAWCEPGVPDYDCDEIPIDLRPIDVLSIENDPFRLDADNDGVGCEVRAARDQDDNGDSRADNGDNGDDRADNGDDRADNGDDRADNGDDLDELADDGTLPETGSAPLLLGGIGTGALAAGLLLFMTGRRRGTGSLGS